MRSVEIIPDRDAVFVKPDPRIPGFIPTAVDVNGHGHLIPHKLDEVRVLRNLGYVVPSPIRTRYDWGGGKPFEAQKTTAAMLVCEPRAYVLNGMGTGKTRSILFAYDFLRREGAVKKMLVVAPLSTLHFTWAREVTIAFPRYRVVVVHGTKEKRQKLLQEDADIYVTNYHGLQTECTRFCELDADVIVVDELTRYANKRTALWKSADTVIRHNRPRFLWGLTGTPTPNTPTQAYGQCMLITPERCPPSFKLFRNQVEQQVSTFKWVPRKDSPDVVKELMSPAVRFRLEDCVDMPPLVEISREAQMSAEQNKAYKQIMAECRAMTANSTITAANAGVQLGKLLQISGGVSYNDAGGVTRFALGDRMEVVRELLAERARKFIIFAPFRNMLDLLEEELSGLGARRIDGSVSLTTRGEIFGGVQNGDLPGIIAHPESMSHGVTLTAADLVIWYSPPMSLETYQQANGRIYRPGQTADRAVIAHIVGSPVERAAYRRLQQREALQNATLELFNELVR